MFRKYIPVLLLICAISQAECRNHKRQEKPTAPESFMGQFLRWKAVIGYKTAAILDKLIAVINRTWNGNTRGLLNGFGNNNKLIDDSEPYEESGDMDGSDEVEVFKPRRFQKNNKRVIEDDSIYETIAKWCTEGKIIPGYCSE